MVHWIIVLFWVGFIVMAGLMVFQLVIGMVVAIVMVPFAGLSWLFHKLKG